MHARDLSPRRAVRQSLIALVALPACGLSTWFTVRFCSRLCPEEGLIELISMGLVWELGKLLLGSESQHNLGRGTLPQRAWTVAQVVFSLLLAAGSVAASLGFFIQSDRAQQQAALSASPAYKREAQSLRDLDAAISDAMSLAAQMQQADHITASRRLQDKAERLRQERAALSDKMSRQESHAHLASIDFFEQVSLALSSSQRSPADSFRFGAHCVLAIALETIGMIFLAKLRASFLFSPRYPCDSADSDERTPPLRLTRSARVKPSSRSRGGAASAPDTTIAKGRGDTGTDPKHEHGTRYRTCMQLLLSGKLEPNYDAIVERFSISNTTARKWLHKMWQEDVLSRRGRRFVAPTGSAAA